MILEVEKSWASQLLVTSQPERPWLSHSWLPADTLRGAARAAAELMKCSRLIWPPFKYDSPYLNYTFIQTRNQSYNDLARPSAVTTRVKPLN